MSLYGMMMKDAEESENVTAKNAIKDYIKGYVAPLNQQVLDIDEQVEKLTDIQEVQTCFNDTVIEGMLKLKENNKEAAGRLSDATNRLSSAENKINELEETVKTLLTTQSELIKTVQNLKEERNALHTIVDMQARELKTISDMYEVFMELLKDK